MVHFAKLAMPPHLAPTTTALANARPVRASVVYAVPQEKRKLLLGLMAGTILQSASHAHASIGGVDAPGTAVKASTQVSQPQTTASAASNISFSRVDSAVTDKLRQRDENMAWKCRGVSMYDCDGELAEAAEKRFEQFAGMFRTVGDDSGSDSLGDSGGK
ncbi:hypothetical protein Agub_g1915 [Astrephomene gubernaculifera]|uniref:Uncharacterized protein n=1 Tax=Astrephomene gubernaculifera TaxID=47775 RepID=A0AAD3HHP6_9CHLO|nr:hypothetical protein Agub_g1915 [Astrephomene gubernaculifera]